MLRAVIIKPTKNCNADCSFCCAPIDNVQTWDEEKFAAVAHKIGPNMADYCNIVFHGGEPLLVDPQLYYGFAEILRSYNPTVRFGMQTNLTLYKSELHKPLFNDVLNGGVSTSMDIGPDSGRTLRGSVDHYQAKLEKKLAEVYKDGFRPLVITNVTSFNRHTAHQLFDYAKSSPFDIDLRINYRYPAGRLKSMGELISPEEYGQVLVDLTDRWFEEKVDFTITPIDQMIKKVIGETLSQCPWTKSCGGKFLGIEPNGDTYNCGEFADLGGSEFRFGNIFENEYAELIGSKPARQIARRAFMVPMDCTTCPHFSECEGGCSRDSVLFDNGLYGKFHYCQSWKMIFSHIKKRLQEPDFAAFVDSRLEVNTSVPQYAA